MTKQLTRLYSVPPLPCGNVKSRILALLLCWFLAVPAPAAVVPVSGVWYPEYLPLMYPVGSGGTSNAVIDASAEKVSFLITAGKACTINDVGFPTGTVTTGDTLKVSFQDPSATDGTPDTTADQFRTVVIADTDDNEFIYHGSSPALGLITSDGTDSGTKRTVALGEQFHVVIEFNGFVAGNMQILTAATGSSSLAHTVRVMHFTSAWANAAGIPLITVRCSDGSYAYSPGTWPGSVFGQITISSSTTPDEAGLLFQVPMKTQVCGIMASIQPAAGQNIEAILYDGSDNVLGNKVYDGDIRAGAASNYMLFPFTGVTLNINSNYRAILKPASTTSSNIRYAEVPVAAMWDSLSGGQGNHWTERTDAGAWTNTTTRRSFIHLQVCGLDNGASGGGAWTVVQ